MTPAVRRSMAGCAEVTRRRAANFYHGLRLTPEPRRSAVYAIYAVLRQCDDIVDGPPSPIETTLDKVGGKSSDGSVDGKVEGATGFSRDALLDRFERQLSQTLEAPSEAELPPGSVWPAFRYVVHQYGIDPALMRLMIEGQRDDLAGAPIDTFEELYAYCYRVASTVGLMCIAIWGHDEDPEVFELAKQRGIALQLTNILRDFKEDASNGRLYLPRAELDAFGCDWNELVAPAPGAGAGSGRCFERLIQYQIERARTYYEASRTLEQHISPDCRATSAALVGLYRAILERIARSPGQVLTRRVGLSALEKLSVAGRAWWQRGQAAQLPTRGGGSDGQRERPAELSEPQP